MKRRKVRGKILLILLVLLAVVILSLAMTVSHLFQTIFTSQRLEELELDVYHYADMAGAGGDFSRLSALDLPPERQLIAIGQEGRVLFRGGSSSDDLEMGWLPETEKIFAGTAVTVKAIDPQLNEPVLVTGVPVGSPTDMALYLIEPATTGDRLIQKMNQVLLLAVFGALLLAGGGSLIVADRMAQPLIRMERMATKLMRGDFTERVKAGGRDELASLGNTLNRLASHLDQVEATRAEFLSNVSHDLRTPLSYIQGYAQILSEGLAQSEADRQTYANIIREEVGRLGRMLDDLLEVAKFEESQFRLEPIPLDMGHVIEEMVHRLTPFAEAKRVDLSYEGSIALPLVLADQARMEQLLINLIQNAIHYTQEGGRVVIQTRDSASQVLVSVVDNGPGIPAEDLPYIWERFYRGDKSRNRTLGGTGIGLSIVKRIVEAHHGQVQVTSELGVGTTVSFVLPRMDDSQKGGLPR
ncbi:sensor histidine kinase [Tumebacillus lipolyticus]|uniref:histidine kinase n=1 Tax=Tumebacillus lipolyticus TaxID=1280370 RepID=A0ABW4ZVN8_9BACL